MSQVQQTNGSDENKKTRERQPMTAVLAITKIGKILDQLSESDRKRVLSFVTCQTPES